MITIDEASKRWGVSKKTILSYIEKEYIDGFECDNAKLLLPDIPKPYIPKSKDIYKSILLAAYNNCFIDDHILRITTDRFHAYIGCLLESGYVRKVESEKSYVLAPKGREAIKKKREITIIPTAEIKASPTINSQVGLINGQVNC